jgi:pyruvate,water dikinase
MTAVSRSVVWFEELGRADIGRVGGKSASLGEMIANLSSRGIKVPPGFAVTADAYWRFVDENQLRGIIASSLAELETRPEALAEAGLAIRTAFLRGRWPADIAEAIVAAYRELGRRAAGVDPDVAVRSSATAEDLPGASFAGHRRPISTSAGSRRFWTPAGAASPPSSPTAPSSTAGSTASTT